MTQGSLPSEPRVSLRVVDPTPVRTLAALFDLPDPAAGVGVLPNLWHWAALASWGPVAGSGVDGHPRRGGLIPDLGRPRRMFAGGEVEFHTDLMLGDEVRFEERVTDIVPKQGSQGEFILVETQTEIFGPSGALAVREKQNLVYRDAATPAASPVPMASVARGDTPRLLTRTSSTRWAVTTDPPKLMRFSAATSNGHRIHYDHPYATQVEGYPGLVVHGPLMTLALLEASRQVRERPARVVRHRSMRPLFCGQPAEISTDDRGAELVGPHGTCSQVDITD